MRITLHTFKNALAGSAVLALLGTGTARADSWNERTIMTFSEPVLVPGATLQPGTYVFQLVDPDVNQHLVRITTEDGLRTITTSHAIPIKRTDPTGHTVLRFNPTAPGVPPALKGWFYPGSLYGHQFVYSEEQARDIAQRTKTVVLSRDVKDERGGRGLLLTYNGEGLREEWRDDPDVMREWRTWREGQVSTVTDRAAGDEPDAAAPMVSAAREGDRVRVDDLEDSPTKYMGRTISVDAEVDDVFGPRVFSIDEPNWGDLAGEILVHVPTALAASVREGDRVTITGELKPYLMADLERDTGWFDTSDELEIELAAKPVFVASRVVGGNSDRALVVTTGDTRDQAAKSDTATSRSATTGATSGSRITQLGRLNQDGEDLIGYSARFQNVKVAATIDDGGFYVVAGDGTQVYVLATESDAAKPAAGTRVDVSGIVLQMPRGAVDHLDAPGDLNEDVYLFATDVVTR